MMINQFKFLNSITTIKFPVIFYFIQEILKKIDKESMLKSIEELIVVCSLIHQVFSRQAYTRLIFILRH